MRKFNVIGAAVAAAAFGVISVAGPAQAAPKGLQTFGTETGSVVTVTGNSATIVNGTGQYGGVYLPKTNHRSIDAVNVSFTSTGDVAGGAPRFSIPIDTDNDGGWDTFAFLDVNNCGSTFVSTENSSCAVFVGSESFANWDAFVAAHPDWHLAKDTQAFIIADQPGSYSVTNIDLR